MICGVDSIVFPVHGDDRGKLIAIENGQEVKFNISRIYYIYDTNRDVVRGKHAHIDLRQVMICVKGSCEVLVDNGTERQTILLNRPERGIFIHDLIWREMMSFSDDCLLLVLVDRPYSAEDYIFDYNEFMNAVGIRKKEKKHENTLC